MTFSLHPQLANDTTQIGEFPLSLVLLHKDSAVPWLILVPKCAQAAELHRLSMQDQQQFLLESQAINKMLEETFQPDKLNLGALGNMVPQLHIHHIARFKHDIAWPAPIWGNTKGQFRSQQEQEKLAGEIKQALEVNDNFVVSG
ncbi:HIT domain-containing protein [Vibrio profundum]|uniref:HIT domain-containing protein n=1 Tax=Vibrio profundum TaxID=2910247 RepID=UPI003D11A294